MYQWISWHQPTEDYRPITAPPHAAVMGWWCSGGDDNSHSLCALVVADDEEQARAIVLVDWPEAERWRFCDPKPNAQMGDRFPLSDWMIERIKQREAINPPTPIQG